MRYRAIPYNIYGVKLYSVEDETGYILKYCDEKEDAQSQCAELNNRCVLL
jgi:hypothetical protein